MNTNKIVKNYVSEVDQFLWRFDKQHPELSKSQQAEIAKAKRVSYLRDHVVQVKSSSQKLWDDFLE